MRQEPQGGEFAAHIMIVGNGVTINTTISGPCAAFIGTADTLRAQGTCAVDLGGTMINRSISIDRVTGGFTSVFGVNGVDGLTYYGTCVPSGPLF